MVTYIIIILIYKKYTESSSTRDSLCCLTFHILPIADSQAYYTINATLINAALVSIVSKAASVVFIVTISGNEKRFPQECFNSRVLLQSIIKSMYGCVRCEADIDFFYRSTIMSMEELISHLQTTSLQDQLLGKSHCNINSVCRTKQRHS